MKKIILFSLALTLVIASSFDNKPDQKIDVAAYYWPAYQKEVVNNHISNHAVSQEVVILCLREQQEATLVVPKTGMISIGDLVVNDVTEIHPRAKAGVGIRLANLALKEVYMKNYRQALMPFRTDRWERNSE